MDEGNIVNELMKRDAELICFDDFMEWSGGGKLEEKPEVFTDQFGQSPADEVAVRGPAAALPPRRSGGCVAV